MILPWPRRAAGLAALACLGLVASLDSLEAQRPRGGMGGGARRPPLLEATGEKVAELNPVARLLKEHRKLELSPDQTTRLDSLNLALVAECDPFLQRIDSLRTLIDRGPGREGQRPAAGRPGERPREPVAGTGGGPLMELWNAVAQVKLRYEAALLSALPMLTDHQQTQAHALVEKDQQRMAAYVGMPGFRSGGG